MGAAPVRTLLGVRVHDLNLDGALSSIEDLVLEGSGGTVVTCNVDHLMLLRKDSGLREAYQAADVVTADGAPLILLGRLTRERLQERVTGADLVPLLPELARRRDLQVALIGGAEGVAAQAAEIFLERHPGLRPPICWSPSMGFEIGGTEDLTMVEAVRAAEPDLVVVCFGAPKQEKWMERHRAVLAPAVLIGAGASLDFVVDRQRRAPRVLQRIGLEWLWRLAGDFPRLWRRYLVQDMMFLPLAADATLRAAVSRRRVRAR